MNFILLTVFTEFKLIDKEKKSIGVNINIMIYIDRYVNKSTLSC